MILSGQVLHSKSKSKSVRIQRVVLGAGDMMMLLNGSLELLQKEHNSSLPLLIFTLLVGWYLFKSKIRYVVTSSRRPNADGLLLLSPTALHRPVSWCRRTTWSCDCLWIIRRSFYKADTSLSRHLYYREPSTISQTFECYKEMKKRKGIRRNVSCLDRALINVESLAPSNK